MSKKKMTGRKPEYRPNRQERLAAFTDLTDADLDSAVGGLNPQPLPPRELWIRLASDPEPNPWLVSRYFP